MTEAATDSTEPAAAAGRSGSLAERAEAALFAGQNVEMIPLSAIVPSATHIQELRRARFSKEALAELADSIRRFGVMQPIVVRPLAAPRGLAKYELVAGERRWLASRDAGLAHIHASVRPLSDEDVLEVQLIENLQREDLHELEEAEGYEELMKLKKIGADALAETLGKSRSYVYARLKLLALCPEARKAFYAGALDASRALLVARIGHHDTQRQALKDLTEGEQPMSYREAHRHVLERYMLRLAGAPFDVKDATLLPRAGACEPCPKRTGNQRDLFADVKSADVCTDPKCFADKRAAHYAAQARRLEAAGKKVVAGKEAKQLFPHWKDDFDYARNRLAGGYVRLDDTTFAGGRERKVAEILGDDHEPLHVQHPGTGEIVQVVTQQAVARASAKRKPSRERAGAGGGRSTDAGAAARRKADIEQLVARRIVEQLLQKPVAFDRQALLYIADCESDAWDAVEDWFLAAFKLPTVTGFHRALKKLSDKDLVRFIVLGAVADGLLSNYGGPSSAFAREVCRRYRIDPKKVRAEVEAEQKAKSAAAAKTSARAAGDGKPTWSTPAPAGKARSGKASDFLAPMQPSDQLAAITGAALLARLDITKKVWSYIKRHGLQDRKQKRLINPDATLAALFGGRKPVSMFEMTKHLTRHLRPCARKKAAGAGKAKGRKK